MIATAMIAGCIQDGRSDGILSIGRRATADTRPGAVDEDLEVSSTCGAHGEPAGLRHAPQYERIGY